MYDKGKAAVVVTEAEADDATARRSTRRRCRPSSAAKAAGAATVGPAARRTCRPSARPTTQVTYQTSPDQALIYRLSGDRNPLHSDPSFAALGGFDRPILHGLCTYGFTGRALLHTLCGGDPARFQHDRGPLLVAGHPRRGAHGLDLEHRRRRGGLHHVGRRPGRHRPGQGDVRIAPSPPARQRFTRAELDSFRGKTVDDLLGDRVDLLFVGINPGLWTAAVNAHFARAGNRFWPALHVAGITPRQVDASGGMSPDDRAMVLAAGIGITNLVPVATARADELTKAELREGAAALVALVERVRPKVVAVLGLTAYRQAFGAPATSVGRQPDRVAGAELWVLPNPSGLNAHETIASLAAAYREAAIAAGVVTVA